MQRVCMSLTTTAPSLSCLVKLKMCWARILITYSFWGGKIERSFGEYISIRKTLKMGDFCLVKEMVGLRGEAEAVVR